MKKLLTILALGMLLISCDNVPTLVSNPAKETTVELQTLAKKDSSTYKVVEKNDTLYILTTKNNIVVKKIDNTSGAFSTFFVLFVVAFFAFVITRLISLD